MTAKQLEKDGKIIDVTDGFKRYKLFDDGRCIREGSVNRFKSRYVWIDDENKKYYLSILRAYYDEQGYSL